jgi:two-component system, chemotaxis family, protein-glutamate methylesterase/glutaminase
MSPMRENKGSPVKTLIVDDAPLMRKVIQQILIKNDDIEVVGTAANGRECLSKILELRPDVVTLDIDMPVMNGITAVKNIMVRHQIPIVIISSMIQDGYFAFEALRLGVVDFVPKPSRIVSQDWGDEEELVRMRVRAASGMKVNRMRRVRRRKKVRKAGKPSDLTPPAVAVMGTTLAGPNTIMHILTKLHRDFSGTVIGLQEIHPQILAPFCSSFNEISPLEVVPVTETCILRPGKAYIASTFNGLQVEQSSTGSGEIALVVTKPGEHPIDELFRSAATHFGDRACGVLLTGLGTDGAEGLREIKAKGGVTVGQEQECCVYPNIVEHALRQDVVDYVLSNQGIAAFLKSWVQEKIDDDKVARERQAQSVV